MPCVAGKFSPLRAPLAVCPGARPGCIVAAEGERGMAMWKEFRDFAMRGNVIDLAIGIIIGAAFGKIVTSLVNDILMPPLGVVLGKVDFTNLFIDLSGKSYTSLADA